MVGLQNLIRRRGAAAEPEISRTASKIPLGFDGGCGPFVKATKARSSSTNDGAQASGLQDAVGEFVGQVRAG
jgi:hypothetical protein